MKEWKIVQWHEVLTIKNGKNQRQVANPEGSFPIYGSGGLMGYADKFICNEGTTIIGRKGSINNPIYVSEKFWNVDTAFGLVPGKELDNKYFYYFCTTYNFLKHNKATTLPSLTKADLLKIKIPLPPLETQKKIAAILDAADAYRQKTKTLVEKYDQLAQSLFLEMFGDPVRNEKRWDKVKFEELVSHDCPLTYGIVQPGEETKDGVPCVRPVDLTSQYINMENLKKISKEISDQFKRTILKGGEILLSVRGSVGLISIADFSLKGSNVTRGIVPIWFDSNVSNKFYFYYLYKSHSIQNQIKGLSKGATLIQLNLSDLRNLELIKPSITLQNQFAERIQLIESQKLQSQASLQKAEELFNCLLQRAFKGELV